MTIKIDTKESITTVIRVMEPKVRKRTTRSVLQKIGDIIVSVKEDFVGVTGALRILAVASIVIGILFCILNDLNSGYSNSRDLTDVFQATMLFGEIAGLVSLIPDFIESIN